MSIFPSKKVVKNKKASQETSSLTVQIAGVFLATVGILWLLSLLTFSSNDPVLLFPHSSSQAVPDNAVGLVGSTVAFAMLTMVGGGAFVVPLILVGFGLTVLWVGTPSGDSSRDGWLVVRDLVGECLVSPARLFFSQYPSVRVLLRVA